MNSWATVDCPDIPEVITLPRLSLFNTATNKVEDVARKELYRIYVCGITPYDATHLGHAATYLHFDLINRYLLASGAQVRFVQNITDIDDPLLERANRDGVNWQDLAHSQIELFRSDMVNLHILPPQHFVGVVEAMSLVTDAIEKLVANGATYQVETDTYFKVHADSHFGERSHLSRPEMETIFAERGGDPQRTGKEDPLDALLWRGRRPNEPYWPSPLGEGRPGWHIECCAIALHFLQPSSEDATAIDIQGGGSDLIFPHHEMSAAQGAILRQQPFANHYVHAGMIGLDGEKMSKSRGNLLFVSKMIESGVDPMVIRWALLNRNLYRDFMWLDSTLADAARDVAKVRGALSRIECAPTLEIISKIASAMANNLDTATALALILNWAEQTENGAEGDTPGQLSRFMDSLLGLAL